MPVFSEREVITIAKADRENVRQSEGSIIELKDGRFLVVWQRFGADGRDEGRNALCAMVSKDGGRTWGNFRVLTGTGPGFQNIQSNSLIRAKNGDILLLYRKVYEQEKGCPELSAGFMARSSDEGETFGEPWMIWDRRPGAYPASSALRRLKSGRLLLPCQYEEGRFTEEQSWSNGAKLHVRPAWSDDDGETWTFYGSNISLPMRGAMEPSAAELADGRLIMVMRNQLGSLFKCYSADGGETWTKPQTTGLKTPESCPVVSNVPGGNKILCIWNNADYDPEQDHFGVRYPLTAALTTDGVTFTDFWDIETGRRIYTNPCVAWTKDGVCLVNYWTCEYLSDGSWGPPDLRLARFRINA
jgi:sialidase-1